METNQLPLEGDHDEDVDAVDPVDMVATDARSSGGSGEPPDEFFGAGDDQPRGRPRSSRFRTALIAGVGAVVIAAGAFFGMHALTSNSSVQSATAGTSSSGNGFMRQGGAGGPGGGVSGTIATISGSTITITTRSGSSKITTTSSTAVTKSSTSSVSAVKVGDHVTVIGTGSSTKIAARRITDSGTSSTTNNGPGNGGRPPNGTNGGTAMTSASGTVKSISGSTITIATSSGSTATVTTSSSTTVIATTTGSVSDLAVGDTIMAMGTTSNGATRATAIVEGSFTVGGAPPNA